MGASVCMDDQFMIHFDKVKGRETNDAFLENFFSFEVGCKKMQIKGVELVILLLIRIDGRELQK